jgi:hypothetical protein
VKSGSGVEAGVAAMMGGGDRARAEGAASPPGVESAWARWRRERAGAGGGGAEGRRSGSRVAQEGGNWPTCRRATYLEEHDVRCATYDGLRNKHKRIILYSGVAARCCGYLIYISKWSVHAHLFCF